MNVLVENNPKKVRILKMLLLVWVSWVCIPSTHAQFSFGTYALKHVNIVDVNSQTILDDYVIVIEGNKIADILPSSEYIPHDTVQALNMTGKYVTPGLIDAHVHFATDPTAERRDNAEKVLEEMLHSGVTAVRDMAGDARALSSLSRDALVGDIMAPNVYYSALMAGSEFFTDPRTIATAQGGKSGAMPYMKAITDSSNLTLEVAQAIGTGAAGIKLYANLTLQQMANIVREANRQHIPVWSHAALMPTKPSQVINSGVISISHASMLVYEIFSHKDEIPKSWTEVNAHKKNPTFWDEEFKQLDLGRLFKQMRESNVVLDATLSLKAFFENKDAFHWRYEMSKRIIQAAKEAGVKVAAGCDTDQATFVQHEMKLLVQECEFTPMEAIVAATRHSAQATGILETEGSIEVGKMANLLLLNSNPTEAIENIDEVCFVIKHGKLYNPE